MQGRLQKLQTKGPKNGAKEKNKTPERLRKDGGLKNREKQGHRKSWRSSISKEDQGAKVSKRWRDGKSLWRDRKLKELERRIFHERYSPKEEASVSEIRRDGQCVA